MGNIYFRGIRLVFEEKEFNCTFVRKNIDKVIIIY